ncbi:pirin family protein [Rufibacter glacialis]|uniref:Pirin family protein n=1 Tax=Rufibacter glacialis TaxID=1259555 RepID=A0A5M8QQS5_9BACT|nr:pirin family protein [Rufibacter glacialis]KAA6437400.1 pirin family protein [Rufibacter glacialis]GGK59598.1 quercetin 2,3-dioxygenase [Rufibacter glacialis]
MRSIKKVHQAEYSPIADLVTYSPLPSRSLQQIDPFLFLNHHGHQVYPPHNRGLPFGPHPHRGMETVTFILEGDILHKDSGGHESVITAGGVQWMTAGRGLIHAEVSSSEFKHKGGPLEILQLWVNLPAKLKMTEPRYEGLQKESIPTFTPEGSDVTVNLVSGNWDGHKGAFETLSDILLSTISFKGGSKLAVEVPAERNIFFYVIRGTLTVNGQTVPFRNLVEFQQDATRVEIEASEDSILLFGHAVPFQEPVVAQGPFVMNTQAEIHQAYADYQQGKFGSWSH